MHRLNVLLFCIVFTLTVQAQQNGVRIVEGVLTDSKTKEPIAFATIGILGSALGTSSNADGHFSFKVPAEWNTPKLKIKISSIGYDNLTLENPLGFQKIEMNPSVTVLRETVIFNSNTTPASIVKKAFSNVKKNYNTKPFVYQSFYRHYCKEDTTYGRLIEAATEVYKRKGYKAQQARVGDKDELRVRQLRRSVDRTKVNQTHVPIALNSITATDFAGFQAKRTSAFSFLVPQDPSIVKAYLKQTDFTLEGITHFDDHEVYKITYRIKPKDTLTGAGYWSNARHTGTLYINTKDYAFVKVETLREAMRDTVQTTSLYKKYENKYYLYHSVKDMTQVMTLPDKSTFSHWSHVESITTDIQLKDFEKFKGKQPSHDELLAIKYDSVFWKTYNILEATPLEDKIVNDIAGDKTLDQEFLAYGSSEQAQVIDTRNQEAKFNDLLKNSVDKLVYIDFWASWCGPCIAQMPYSKALVEKYKDQIVFVYVSIDANRIAWQQAVKQFQLEQPGVHHFHFGTHSDASAIFDIRSIPRYILVDKAGNYVDLNAKRPSDPSLEKDFERLLAEKIEN